MKKNIVFVCNGNIHRSVVAEKYLNKLLKKHRLNAKFVATSYGLQGTKGTAKPLHKNLTEYPKEWKAAFPTLRQLNIDVTNHSFQKITPAIIKKAAVVIAMDKKVYIKANNSLIKQFPSQKNKIHIFSELTKNHQDIKDPAGSGSSKIHQATIKKICSTTENKIKTIIKWAGSAQ